MNTSGFSFVWDLHGCTKYTALTGLKKVQNMWKEKTIKFPDLADMICEQSCRSSSHADLFLQGGAVWQYRSREKGEANSNLHLNILIQPKLTSSFEMYSPVSGPTPLQTDGHQVCSLKQPVNQS